MPATMRAILSNSVTVRGFLNYEFAAEHYPAFLREVGAGIADGRIRYREDFVDGLENAPELTSAESPSRTLEQKEASKLLQTAMEFGGRLYCWGELQCLARRTGACRQ